MKQATLGFIIQDGKILLAMKKRGFGEGFYNGFGGKLEKGESPEQAMIREAKEEIGINIEKLEKVGDLEFLFEGNEKNNMKVYVFIIKKYSGDIIETEEMKPYWFDLDKIPFDKMWKDDKIWLPEVLSGTKNIKYKFSFNKEGKLKYWSKIK